MARPAVLFDVDGTLLRLPGVGRAAMQRAMAEVWNLPNALVHVSFAGATDGAIARSVGRGKAPEPMWDRYVHWLERGLRALPAARPLDGTVELLDALADAGLRLGLLTGNIRRGARLKLDAVGLWGRFDAAFSAFGDDGTSRQDVAAVARERCGEGPLVVVGDSVADVAAGRHVGARVLLTATGFTERADLERAQADLLVKDLTATSEIAGWITAG